MSTADDQALISTGLYTKIFHDVSSLTKTLRRNKLYFYIVNLHLREVGLSIAKRCLWVDWNSKTLAQTYLTWMGSKPQAAEVAWRRPINHTHKNRLLLSVFLLSFSSTSILNCRSINKHQNCRIIILHIQVINQDLWQKAAERYLKVNNSYVSYVM